ncbi:MAG TPA: RDD family protein [Allosphingosinicella sp.]|nr:RDD family protein [Allosphingosinicella sp.]
MVTPEGVDLGLTLAAAGQRMTAFMLDCAIIGGAIFAMSMVVLLGLVTVGRGGAELLAMLWLVGFFLLRNGYFVIMEMGPRAATLGKRIAGLRVVARSGGRLTADAVIARNLMREIEVFLPLSFLGAQAAEGTADAFLILFALVWSGIFLFFPLFNRDRLRIGDIVAGTWVVRTAGTVLGADLVHGVERPRRTFSEAALNLYGVYELQTLEDVLRSGREEAIATVARAIRDKAGIDEWGDDYGFLSDYYAALCARLEGGLMVGRRRANKFEATLTRPA